MEDFIKEIGEMIIDREKVTKILGMVIFMMEIIIKGKSTEKGYFIGKAGKFMMDNLSKA